MNATMRLHIIASGRRAQAVIKQTQGQVGGLTRQMNAATASATRMNASMRMRNLDRFAKDLQWVGRQIEFNFTLPLLVAGGFAMKWALDNESAMTRVNKVYNNTANVGAKALTAELEQVARGFRLISDITGVVQEEVILTGAAFAQAGASGAALLELTELAQQVSILGDFAPEDAANNLIAIQQQYALAVADSSSATFSLTDAMASLNAIENATAVKFSDLTDVLADAGGVARNAGVTINELGAAAASLVPAAGTASEAGNGLKTMITRLMAPANQGSEALRALGLDIDDSAWASKGFSERLQDTAVALGNVSEAQAFTALKHIAGIRQVSRLSILLADLTDENGKYARALEVTASQEDALATMYNELSVFYASSPQQLKILTTQIRNLLTQGFAPLIPFILQLVHGVKSLMERFNELSPAVKQTLFYLGLLLFVIGPLMRIVGASLLLFSRFGLGVIAVFGRVGLAMSIAAKAIVASFVFISKGLFALVISFSKAMLLLGKSIAAIQVGLILFTKGLLLSTTAAFKYMIAFFVVVWKSIAVVMTGIASMSVTWGKGLVAVFVAFSKAIVVAQKMFWVGLVTMWAGGWKMLVVISKAAVPLLLSPWTWLVLAIVGVIAMLWEDIKAFMQSIVDIWWQLPANVRDAMISLLTVVRTIAMKIYEAMQRINPFARHSPSLVDNVKAGVAVIAAEYASLGSIGESFSRATSDMKAFGKATADAKRKSRDKEFSEQRSDTVAVSSGAGDEFDAVVRDIYKLESALSSIQIEYSKQSRVVTSWTSSLDNANFALEAQELILRGLTDASSSLSSELGDAQSRLDSLMDIPIEGMLAYSDALFGNQQAQSAVRLELLRLEEAYGTVDGLRSRMSALSGDIEMLGGQREDLRAAGAGSDILNALDSQINNLEAERRALNEMETGPAAEMENLNNQLKDLQRNGEILDLEKSLEFDPLTRQIQQLVNGMDEVPFKRLISDVASTQGEVARLTAEYDKANAAVDRQTEVVSELTRQREAIESTYDMELNKLDELAGAYSGIESQVKEMISTLNMFSTAAASSAAGAEGYSLGPEGDFGIPGGPGAGLTGGDMDGVLAGFEDELDGMFEGFNFWSLLKEEWAKVLTFMEDKWTGFLKWMDDQGIDISKISADLRAAFTELFDGIKTKFTEMFNSINTEKIASKFNLLVELFRPIGDAFIDIWNTAKGLFVGVWDEITENFDVSLKDILIVFNAWATGVTFVIGLVISAFTLVWPVVRNVFQSVLNFIVSVFGGVTRIFSGFIKFLAGVFSGDLKKALEGIKLMAQGVWNVIAAFITLVVNGMLGIVNGLFEGIESSFNWLLGIWNNLPFVKGKMKIDFEVNIPKLAKMDSDKYTFKSKPSRPPVRDGWMASRMAAGGVVDKPTMALIGEYSGARRNPEIVTPENLMRKIFNDTLEDFGGGGGARNFTFTGDLSFPNINNGEDAEDFVRNLESMVN